VWLKLGSHLNAKVGKRLFFDMRPSGANSWTGKAASSDTGSIYSAKMSVEGSTLEFWLRELKLVLMSNEKMTAAIGTNRLLEAGQSMSALPGYFRHQLVPLLPRHHPLRCPDI
jgi:hypothetical protein